MRINKRLVLSGAVVVATTLTVGAFYNKRGGADAHVVSVSVTRGDIVDTVVATGALEAVTTVQVGSQLSGTIQTLNADFNSIVHTGEVLARLEPSLYQSQVEQADASLTRARADLDRLAVTVDDANTQLKRARELFGRTLIPATDLEAAEVQARSAEAQRNSAAAQVTQAVAALNQAKVSLEKTVITAPIDGFVIARSVDVGQTVAASLQAPTLFVIAADLTKMRVNAGVDESDVGRVQPGQAVTFHVDAYPAETFKGTVSQVRLSPIVLQNVVTYATVIDVPNEELKLKPGMTATVNIETARRDNVLRVPGSALRFKPTPEMVASLGRPVSSLGSAADGAFQPLTGSVSNGAGRVWLDENGTFTPREVKTGLTNGTFTELVAGDVTEGTRVVTGVALAQPKATAPVAANPLFGTTPGGRGFGGGGNGGGAGRAR